MGMFAALRKLCRNSPFASWPRGVNAFIRASRASSKSLYFLDEGGTSGMFWKPCHLVVSGKLNSEFRAPMLTHHIRIPRISSSYTPRFLPNCLLLWMLGPWMALSCGTQRTSRFRQESILVQGHRSSGFEVYLGRWGPLLEKVLLLQWQWWQVIILIHDCLGEGCGSVGASAGTVLMPWMPVEVLLCNASLSPMVVSRVVAKYCVLQAFILWEKMSDQTGVYAGN